MCWLMSRTNGFGAAAVKAVTPTVSEWYRLLCCSNARAYNSVCRLAAAAGKTQLFARASLQLVPL